VIGARFVAFLRGHSVGVVAPLHLEFIATPEHVGRARVAVTAFAERLGIIDTGAVQLAVSEAISNAVIHAYRDRPHPGFVSVAVEHPPDDGLRVTVEDQGCGLTPRSDSPGMGLGLSLVARLAQCLEISTPASGGTRVCMGFARV
jgi:serine/threonine-protein kinase RsbW